MENENRRRPERWRSGIGITVLPVERFSPLMKGKYGSPKNPKDFLGKRSGKRTAEEYRKAVFRK